MSVRNRSDQATALGLTVLALCSAGCGADAPGFSELAPWNVETGGADSRDDECGPYGDPVSVGVAARLAIPDGTGASGAVNQTVTATESFPIAALEVRLSVDHTWVGDLTLRLDHGGRTMRLIDRSLSPGTEEFGCTADNYVDVVLDQHGTGGLIEDACQDNLTSPPSFVPVDNLDTFVGLDFAGEWKLSIYDNEHDDTGSLVSWTVTARPEGEACPTCFDQDEDGVTDCDGDCNDLDGGVNPDAVEICDSLDNDCDGAIDDDDVGVQGQETFYADDDTDGYGDADTEMMACSVPEGYVGEAGDCDDGDGEVNPGADEVCNGIDDNCDGLIDDADPSVQATDAFHPDADGDGAGDPNETMLACVTPDGFVDNDEDCDDANGDVHPGAGEVCDGTDNNCDGLIDDADPDASGQSTWYADGDDDGFGSEGATGPVTTAFPSAPSSNDQYTYRLGYPWMGYAGDSYVAFRTDGDLTQVNELTFDFDVDQTYLYCDAYLKVYFDDQYLGYAYLNWTYWYTHVSATVPVTGSNAEPHKVRVELYNTVYNSKCWYSAIRLDVSDGTLVMDGTGPSTTVQACAAPDGYVADAGDCNDGDGGVNPDAPEVCNGKDDDCDGGIDEGAGTTYYADRDCDGYGSDGNAVSTCGSAPSGYTSRSGDCNDSDKSVNPAAAEKCDGIDNDCDGLADDADSSVTGQTAWWPDANHDGYGDGTNVSASFKAPAAPSSVDVYQYALGYPYMGKAGDAYTATRDTPTLDWVDQVSVDLKVNTNRLYCTGNLLFYLDGEYLGYATVNPYCGTQTIKQTLGIEPSDGQRHTFEVEMYSTVYKSSCGYSYVTLDTSKSNLTLTQRHKGAGEPVFACQAPAGYGR